MKKLFTLLALAVALTASAQSQPKKIVASNLADNWYLGLHTGVNTQTTNNAWLKNLNPTVGLRIGRWMTPTFGMFIDADFDLRNKTNTNHNCGGNFFKVMDLQLGVQSNLMNLFGGYKGEPRVFELLPFFTLGWGHLFLTGDEGGAYGTDFSQEPQCVTSKVGFDIAFNIGKYKEVQLYIEPAMRWTIANGGMGMKTGEHQNAFPLEYNINKSKFQITAGFIYKIKNSNGTHNFALAEIKDQSEIDALNGKVNDLRAELANKEAELNRLKKALNDCESKPAPTPVVVEKEVKKDPMQTNLMPKVIFKVGQSTVDASQLANVEMIAKYMKSNPNAKVLVKGYASPEGNPELNQKLSVQRANAAKDALVKKYGISASRIVVEGCGPTSELSDVLDFNRVATFSDTTK